MGKSFYTEYVRHCLRHYVRYPTADSFLTKAEQDNWNACERVISTYPEIEQRMLRSVYQSRYALPEAVGDAAYLYDVAQKVLWDLMKKFEYEIAQARGLI